MRVMDQLALPLLMKVSVWAGLVVFHTVSGMTRRLSVAAFGARPVPISRIPDDTYWPAANGSVADRSDGQHGLNATANVQLPSGLTVTFEHSSLPIAHSTPCA